MKPDVTKMVRVAAAEMVSPRVKKVTLEPIDGTRLPAFSPGSHIVLRLTDGVGHWSNSYSLIGQPSETRFYQIAVRKQEPGLTKGGSVFLHEKIHEGAELQIRTPRNFFPIARDAGRHVLIAGGIGITPFLSYLPVLRQKGSDFELHYAFRDAASGAFAGHLCETYPHQTRFYVSEEGRRLSPRTLLANQPLGTHIYVCGPGSLILDVQSAASELGYAPSCVHIEEFAAPLPADSKPFMVNVPEYGLKLDVSANETVLEALERAKLPIPSSCRIGQCGTCEVKVLNGEPDHRDRCFTEDEWSRGRFLACVSRCRGEALDIALAN